jgi:hypothetical protein
MGESFQHFMLHLRAGMDALLLTVWVGFFEGEPVRSVYAVRFKLRASRRLVPCPANHKRFYEKVIKVKADVAALLHV